MDVSQGSQDINQQFVDGGVIPGQLVSQDATSKTYVDGQLAQRDANISGVAASAAAAQATADAGVSAAGAAQSTANTAVGLANTAQGSANTAQSTIDLHKASAVAHSAASITYTGPVEGAANTKQAIDLVKQRVDTIVAGAGESNTEILDARQPATGPAYPILGARLNNVDAQLADTAEQVADTVHLTAFKRLVGETDDTGRLQRAIDSFEGNLAGTILIADTIYISEQITVHKTGLRLQGVGNKKSKIISSYAGISLFVKPLYNGAPYTNSGYCKFFMENIAIQATGDAVLSGTGIWLQWIYASRFTNIYTSGFAKHIVLKGSHLNSFYNLYQENADTSDQGIEIHNRGVGLSGDDGSTDEAGESTSNNNNIIGGWIHNTSWDLSYVQLTSVQGIDIEPASNSFILGYGNTFRNCRFERMDHYAVVNNLYPRFPWFVLTGDSNKIKDCIYGAGGANNSVDTNPIFQVNSNLNEIDVYDGLSFNTGLMAFGPEAEGNIIHYDADYADYQNTGNNSGYKYEVTSVKYNTRKNRFVYRDKIRGTQNDIVGSYSKAQGQFVCRSSKNVNIVSSADWAYEGVSSSAVDIDLPIGKTPGDTAFTKVTVSSGGGNRRMYLDPAKSQTVNTAGVVTLIATVFIPESTSANLSVGVYLSANTTITAKGQWVTVRCRAYLTPGNEIIPTFQLTGNVGDVFYVGDISVCDGNVAAYVPNSTTSVVSVAF